MNLERLSKIARGEIPAAPPPPPTRHIRGLELRVNWRAVGHALHVIYSVVMSCLIIAGMIWGPKA